MDEFHKFMATDSTGPHDLRGGKPTGCQMPFDCPGMESKEGRDLSGRIVLAGGYIFCRWGGGRNWVSAEIQDGDPGSWRQCVIQFQSLLYHVVDLLLHFFHAGY